MYSYRKIDHPKLFFQADIAAWRQETCPGAMTLRLTHPLLWREWAAGPPTPANGLAEMGRELSREFVDKIVLLFMF